METIAIYWEPIIKTYGFQEKAGLALGRLTFPLAYTAEWGQRIAAMADSVDSFLLAIAQPVDGKTLQLNLLLEGQGLVRIGRRLDQGSAENPPAQLEMISPVELLYFQGPHFGDRYGIAAAAWTALSRGSVPVLALACTGASVYLILPEGKTKAARAALGEAFAAPEPAKGDQRS